MKKTFTNWNECVITVTKLLKERQGLVRSQAAQPQDRWRQGLGRDAKAGPPGKGAGLNCSAPWSTLPGGSHSYPGTSKRLGLPQHRGRQGACPPPSSAESAASKSPCGPGREPAWRPWAGALHEQAEEWVHGRFPAVPHAPLLSLGSTPNSLPCSQDGCVETCLELAFCRCLHMLLHILIINHLHQAQVSGS